MLNYMLFAKNKTLSSKKPVMVMIHGLGGGFANWYTQVSDLKKEYDLLLIELPSHGRSPYKLSEMELSYDVLSEKVMEVLDHLGIEKAIFAGVSFGTMVVKHIVMNYPERVEKYILAGPIGEFNFAFDFALKLVKLLLPIAPIKFTIRLVVSILMPYKISKQCRDIFLACAKKLPKKEFIAYCKLFMKFKDIQKKYQSIMGPEKNGLYIVGAHDYFFIPLLKNDRKRIKNIVFVEKAGHVCNVDQPVVVNKLIVDFNKRVEA